MVQNVPDDLPSSTHAAFCCRCDKQLGKVYATWIPAAAASCGLLLFPLALILPIMRVEKLGIQSESGIADAVLTLLRSGHTSIALVIFFFSIALPFCKFIGILVLLLPEVFTSHQRHIHKRWVYEVVELSGRWGMVDVILVAVLVSMLKLNDLMSVQAGTGLYAFLLMVVASIIAGLSIHSHALFTQPAQDSCS